MQIQKTNQHRDSSVNFGMHIKAKGNLLKNMTSEVEHQISTLNSRHGSMEPLNQDIFIDVVDRPKTNGHVFHLTTFDTEKENQELKDIVVVHDGLFDKNKQYSLPSYDIHQFLKKIHTKLYYDRSYWGINANAQEARRRMNLANK